MTARITLPRVGLFACFSGGSNSGSLAGMGALEVVRRLGNDAVGVCSLPAVLSGVPRQSALVQKIGKIVVIDGCHNECARQLLAGAGIVPNVYLNLETDLHLSKQGPFSGLEFTADEIDQVADAIAAVVGKMLHTAESSAGDL